MNTYLSTTKGPLKIPGFIDPDDTTNIQIFWGAPIFSSATTYHIDDIVRPTIDNGYYYKCVTTGVTGDTEPAWTQSSVTSGTAQFDPCDYDLYVMPGQSISDSTWSTLAIDPVSGVESSLIVSLSNKAILSVTTSATIDPILESVSDFLVTNQITKSTGETLSRTFKYKINQQ